MLGDRVGGSSGLRRDLRKENVSSRIQIHNTQPSICGSDCQHIVSCRRTF
jgi:hypothetical protein